MEAMQTETILRGTICEENTNQLDSVLPSVLKIVLDEIFDKAAATVESGYHSKIKLREVRQGKALDYIGMFGQLHFFSSEQSIHILVQPFLTRTREPSRNGGVAEVNKCKEAFIRLRAGLLKNPAVDQENLLVYCHHAITHQHVVNNNNGDEDEDDEEPTIPVRGAVYADRLLYVPGQQLTGSTSHEKSNKRLKQQRQSEQHREYVFIEFVLDWIQHAMF
ncbi:hypothetical protein BASA81_018353 [Batrachochytrium salamandrivorans]|nr:hypothetical protein BASA81_018353 [Batrachochytrium salamandrivorans]